MYDVTRRSFVRGIGASAFVLGTGSSVGSNGNGRGSRATAFAAEAPSAAKPARRFDVGNRKQLFIDERFIENKQGVRLTVNPPTKCEKVILAEKPWELVCLGFYASVLEDDGLFKLWYDAYVGTSEYEEVPRSVCYATSEDGLHWQRPSVNLFDWRGHRENNIVMPGAVYSPVMIDPNAPRASRYKALGIGFPNSLWPESRKMHWDLTGGGIYVFTSADGLKWKCHLPVASPFFHDSQPVLLYDTRLQKYVVYFRTHRKGRTLSRVEIDHPLNTPYKHRTPPATVQANQHGLFLGDNFGAYEMVMACDDKDPPASDLQTMPIVQYPYAQDVYLGLATIYRHFAEDVPGVFKNDGVQDVQLAVSRDGIRWERPERKPYIPLGIAGSWDGGCIWPALGLLRRGNEIWQYYCGTDFSHGKFDGKPHRAGGLCRVVQRLDGFVSVDASEAGGLLTTPTITFSGSQLQVNVDCSALGNLRIALLDEADRPIPGYTIADSIPVEQNSIGIQARWKSGGDLRALTGRPIKVQFSGTSFKLYAFQFAGDG